MHCHPPTITHSLLMPCRGCFDSCMPVLICVRMRFVKAFLSAAPLHTLVVAENCTRPCGWHNPH